MRGPGDRCALRLDAAARQADVGRALQRDCNQRLSNIFPAAGKSLHPVPLSPDVFRVFQAGNGKARFSERTVANNIEIVPLHALGAVRNE